MPPGKKSQPCALSRLQHNPYSLGAPVPLLVGCRCRSVVVVSSLIDKNKERRREYAEDILEEVPPPLAICLLVPFSLVVLLFVCFAVLQYDDMREEYLAGLEDRSYIAHSEAVTKRLTIDWDATPPVCFAVRSALAYHYDYFFYPPLFCWLLYYMATWSPQAPTPKQLGVHKIEGFTVKDIEPYIDWNPFFQVMPLPCQALKPFPPLTLSTSADMGTPWEIPQPWIPQNLQ